MKIIKLYNDLVFYLSNEDKESIINFINKNNESLKEIINISTFKIYPIHYLCINDIIDIELIEILINIGFKLQNGLEQKTILFYLLKFKTINLEILNLLKDNDFDFNTKDIYNENILHYLCYYEYDDDIFNFIKDNINEQLVNQFDVQPLTPLLLSTQINNNKTTYNLLKLNCNINNRNYNNNTSLMYACMNNNLKLVQKLIDMGGDINLIDNQNDIAFFYACGCDNKDKLNLELIKYLISLNIDKKHLSEDNYNALHYASGVNNNNTDYLVIDYLLSINIDPNIICNIKKKTFIYYFYKNSKNKILDKQNIKKMIKKYDLIKYENINNDLIFLFYDDDEFLDILKFNKTIVNKLDSFCLICKDSFESKSKIISCKNNHHIDLECMIIYNNNKCPLCLEIINIKDFFFIK